MLLDHVHSAAASGFKTASGPELRLVRGTRYGGSAPASQSALTFHVGPEFALGRNCPTTNGGGRFQRALSESWGSPVVSNGLGRVSNGICLRPRGMHEPQASDPQIVHCNNMPKYHSRRLSSSVRQVRGLIGEFAPNTRAPDETATRGMREIMRRRFTQWRETYESADSDLTGISLQSATLSPKCPLFLFILVLT